MFFFILHGLFRSLYPIFLKIRDEKHSLQVKRIIESLSVSKSCSSGKKKFHVSLKILAPVGKMRNHKYQNRNYTETLRDFFKVLFKI